MHIVILGAPGAGKGTQAQLISTRYNIPAISTGDLLRIAASNPNDDLSSRIANTIGQGILVSNDLIIQVIRKRLSMDDCKNGFILDGFPRSLEQAKLMNEIFSDGNQNIVMHIEVKKDILLQRLLGRFSCKSCGTIYNKFFLNTTKEGTCDVCEGTNFVYRNDDDEQIIRNRMNVYEAETKPMIEYYESEQNDRNYSFVTFNGGQSVNSLSSDIQEYLDNFIK